MTQAVSALTVRELSFSYPDRPDVLQRVSFDVHPGERIGLIGPNGSGKTTLFLAASGILTPTVGTVQLFGQTVRPGQFHPQIGMVFQNPDEQLFCASVRADIAFGVSNLGLPAGEIAAAVEYAMQQTGVSRLADYPPHRLSGGEKRMVAIAGVIAMQPGLILYDEPDAYLDHRARRRLVQFLQTYPAAAVIATHDLELVNEVCHRVLVLDNGTLAAAGSPRDVFSNGALMECHGFRVPISYR